MAEREEKELAPRKDRMSDPFGDWDDVFESFRTGLEDLFWTPPGRALEHRLAADVRTPAVDLADTGDAFVVTAELPGVSKDNLDLTVTEDGVEIRAQVAEEEKREEKGYYFRERSHRMWFRRLPFPAEALPDRADAELKDGVLTVRVPKAEPAVARKPRKVPVK